MDPLWNPCGTLILLWGFVITGNFVKSLEPQGSHNRTSRFYNCGPEKVLRSTQGSTRAYFVYIDPPKIRFYAVVEL